MYKEINTKIYVELTFTPLKYILHKYKYCIIIF